MSYAIACNTFNFKNILKQEALKGKSVAREISRMTIHSNVYLIFVASTLGKLIGLFDAIKKEVLEGLIRTAY